MDEAKAVAEVAKEPSVAPKRSRGPPKNEDIWQHFTKLKDAGKYHNYWYVECKCCRAAFVENAAGTNEGDIPAPSPIVSRIHDMRRHLSNCAYVSDYVPDDNTSPRPTKLLKTKDDKKSVKSSTKGGSGSTSSSSNNAIVDKEDKELLRRDMEHRWDMERRRMALEEHKNARIDQKLARQEEEAQIHRRLLLAKAQEAELQLKVAYAKARHELLQAGMTPEHATVSSSSPTVKTVKAYTPQLAHLTGCPLRESMIHFLGNLRSLDSWKKEEEELAPQLAHLDLTNSPFVKSPMSRSSDIPRLLEFMAESAVQMNFLIRLPSIERCLAEW
ncbi:hypothetical protein DYB30_010347 [Aphanomyces astaci]|uniref:BED-type domain-containing protein n=1 Tax=Aphanomyces astaci TaxID=112090 RepID=A0A397BK99_APHAT|nr:hypothetical protein DYB36_010210 [Aphanomyces astaci]RHY48859.1 hypothetical protein DYB30_010347 [Aphanomyces astaci]RHZ04912.1 hypothetical protein DYB26_004708 [Aphanomyces astaci]